MMTRNIIIYVHEPTTLYFTVMYKGVGRGGTILAWSGWKQTDIYVKVYWHDSTREKRDQERLCITVRVLL